ncbi:hypothetical protein HWV62_24398 [Athelia sp. TMB]|nr:hypothetical protein HWV62_24398 [Athelia sp. TMB]
MVNPYIAIVDHTRKLIRFTSFVEVPPEATVNELKKKVVETERDQKALDDLDVLDPEDAQERIQSIFADKMKIVRVGGRNVVSTKFSDGEILVVEIVKKENLAHLRALMRSLDDSCKRKGLDDREDSRKRLRKAIRKAAPSSLAVATQFKAISGPEDAIGCNHPFENDTVPICLLDETFGLFKDRCRRPPSTKAMTLLVELASAVCEWHNSEDSRKLALRRLFKSKAELSFMEEVITVVVEETDSTIECTTDGNLSSNIMPAAILGCKNESGRALYQAILYDSRFLDIALSTYAYCDSRFPCIILLDTGFYGCLWDGSRVRAEPLTPMFDLATHCKARADREAIASSLDAFMEAVARIESHYHSIKQVATNTPRAFGAAVDDEARGLPCKTHYEDAGRDIWIAFDERISDENLVFAAHTSEPEKAEVLVKFTDRYSADAHRHLALAPHGAAPRLRGCFPVAGGWLAVVMEQSEYKQLFAITPELTPAERAKVQARVREIVDTLHGGGFVHGDIRSTNLLVDRASLGATAGDVKIHLIDYDWAGLDGEATYPIGINRSSVTRPDGAEGGKLITKAHDIEMISYLFKE